ncbi:lipopolysaccharide biosynthesis protein [Devosia rhodophyticola]|uniref:Lipopolysaccharide biosynthesis protein n=1 Tax=Devosia rhodophyticola TaxID=3026423 RepID=A0ABY7YWA5_9HYPH|nr:lipopolysaccharide biosynthesis protein [Devosia rhodophyticola]WDR05383.1 lipopolysaccharide biosynthesis protein [Devosia rhodophyticola]
MGLHRRLASQSTVIFAVRIFGAALVFLVQALLARYWGAEVLGEYLLIVATVNLVAVAMPLGFHTVGTYFSAEYRARGDRRRLKIFLFNAYGHVLGAMAVLLIFGHYVLDWVGAGNTTLAAHFVPASLLAFGTATIFVNGAALVGLKRPYAGFFADTMFRPLTLIAAFLIGATFFATPDEGFSAMLWVVSVGYCCVALVHFGFVMFTLPRVGDTAEPGPSHRPRWWRFAMPWVLVSLATDFFFDIDLLLLSSHLSREELAVFGVCTRIFSLVSFGVAAVYAVTLPDIFESEANADRSGFNRKLGDANLVASGLAVLLLVLTAIGGPLALTIFGPTFVNGSLPLVVLCLALVVRSAMGPASLVLSIHDRPYASLPAIVLALGSLLLGNYLLVPPFGLMGAAVAALISITLWSVALWAVALKTAHIDVSIMQWFRRGEVVAKPAE